MLNNTISDNRNLSIDYQIDNIFYKVALQIFTIENEKKTMF
ncbi:hypothetical protein BC781_102134 [Sediminitomix flava]|uniref:Uncharacterized protein n=1 Tax=Sediminitomix flava TaxID=379075 RepID=A0A315ZB56_SEDFL|nr:hypothetical protein BC781_102134 [Sediminitomix flava]